MLPVKVMSCPPSRWTYPTCVLKPGENLAHPLRLFAPIPPAKPLLATKIWPSADSTNACGIATDLVPLVALFVSPPPVPLTPSMVVTKLCATCH